VAMEAPPDVDAPACWRADTRISAERDDHICDRWTVADLLGICGQRRRTGTPDSWAEGSRPIRYECASGKRVLPAASSESICFCSPQFCTA